MNPNRDKSYRTSDVKSQLSVSGIAIMGRPIDHQTRCEHYHSSVDIVAIKFKCCDQYFPCYQCHEETAGHRAEIWTKEHRDVKAILCGVCGFEMTILDYFSCRNQCPGCHSNFNPDCEKHYQLYFEL